MTKDEKKPNPNVATFEEAVKAKNYDKACLELLAILEKIDGNFGEIQRL